VAVGFGAAQNMVSVNLISGFLHRYLGRQYSVGDTVQLPNQPAKGGVFKRSRRAPVVRDPSRSRLVTIVPNGDIRGRSELEPRLGRNRLSIVSLCAQSCL